MRSHTLTKTMATISLAFTMAVPAALIGSAPAGAVPTSSTTEVTDLWGGSASNLDSGSDIKVVSSGYAPTPGKGGHSITSCFDRGTVSLNSGTVKVPGGYTLFYSTNEGSTWSKKAPRNLDNVNCLKAEGTIDSDGLINGQQAWGAEGLLAPPASVGKIELNGGGDGFDVFFDPAYTKVFNVYHHSSPNSIDCHVLVDGSSCWGAPQSLPFGTNHRSSGVVVGDNVWVAGGDGSMGAGFACVKLSGGLCTTSFVKAIEPANVSGSSGSYNNFDGPIAIGTKIYGLNWKNGNIGCVDTATNAKCPSEPAAGYSVGTPPAGSNGYSYSGLTATRTDFVNIGDLLFFTDGATEVKNGYVGCLDTSTMSVCSGTWPVAAAGPRLALLPSGAGLGDGVCTFGSTTLCFDTSGSSVGSWSALNTRFTTTLYPSNKADGVGPNVMSTVATQGSRLYWSRGSWSGGQNLAGTVDCWDFATNAACPHFPITPTQFQNAATSSQGTTYSVRADPHVANCIWTNDNYANILSWNTTDGTNQCKAPKPAGGSNEPVHFGSLARKILPKMSCDGQNHDLAAWGTATVTTSLKDGQQTHLFVEDSNGADVANWQDVTATVSGGVSTYDLSGLSIAETGQNPRFRIENAAFIPASVIKMHLTAAGDVPQLCFQANVHVSCPSIKALDAGALPSDVSGVVSSVVSETGGSSSSNGSYSVTGASIWDCATSPAAPRLQKVIPGKTAGSVTLNFSDAPHFGGMPSSAQYYWWSSNDDSGWLNTTDPKSINLTGLSSGWTCFHMQTTTDYGWSYWSNERCIYVPGAPSQPYFTGRDWANSTLYFSWEPPYDFGGARNMLYVLKVYNGNGDLVKTVRTKAWEAKVTGLQNASSYTATIQAVSIYGSSGTDSISGTPAGPIGQPTNVTWSATGDRTSLNLAWNAPLYDSNDGLDYYEVCAYDGGYQAGCWTTGTESVTVTGLTPKVRYNFIVFAHSTNGNVKGSPIFRHRGQ